MSRKTQISLNKFRTKLPLRSDCCRRCRDASKAGVLHCVSKNVTLFTFTI